MTHAALAERCAYVDRQLVRSLFDLGPDGWAEASSDYELRQRLAAGCREMTVAAYRDGNRAVLADLHEALAEIYDRDFAMAPVDAVDCETQPILRDIAAVFEHAMLGWERDQIGEPELAAAPTTGKEYVRWVKSTILDHPAGNHPLYREFLAQRATPADFRYFMAQETSLDPRFDDILALMQVGVTGVQKMEIAGNYWDELGNGEPADVHTAMFAKTLESIGVDSEYLAANLMLEARISGNLSAALALSRRHYYKAAGFFAVTEYLVPRRFRQLTSGWRRAGLPEAGIRYHDLHIGIDAVHASGWFKNVVAKLVDDDPRAGREIAIGALMRLNSSQRYLDTLLTHLDRR